MSFRQQVVAFHRAAITLSTGSEKVGYTWIREKDSTYKKVVTELKAVAQARLSSAKVGEDRRDEEYLYHRMVSTSRSVDQSVS
jgi:alpha-D-ribose 1-methylphosphonate 5-triphosphate synthase subunit PhnG